MHQNYQLNAQHSFALAAVAAYFVCVDSVAQVKALISTDIWQQNPHYLLGEGSNTLFVKDFNGVVVKNDFKGIEIHECDHDSVILTVGAGENWHQLVEFCIQHDFYGIENLSLIPGSVGAAPIQNIGAYGVELKQVFDSLEAIELNTGQSRTFDLAACQFGYRDSVFKHSLQGKYLITSVNLKLSKKPSFNTSYGAVQQQLDERGVKQLSLRAVSDAVIAIRQSKLPDPKKIANAGSFFKNPIISNRQYQDMLQQYPAMPSYMLDQDSVKIPAAWLIEQVGWKGKRVGNVGVHDKQALVLVNYGDATGPEILALADAIQQDVGNTFGIVLQPEVHFVPTHDERHPKLDLGSSNKDNFTNEY